MLSRYLLETENWYFEILDDAVVEYLEHRFRFYSGAESKWMWIFKQKTLPMLLTVGWSHDAEDRFWLFHSNEGWFANLLAFLPPKKQEIENLIEFLLKIDLHAVSN